MAVKKEEPTGKAARRRGPGRPPVEGLVERRRSELVQASFELFAEQGYTATSVDDIAERAGLGKGTFYRYFDSKRDILDDAVDFGVEHIIAEAFRAPPKRADSLDELGDQFRDVADRLLALVAERPGLIQVLLLEAMAVDPKLDRIVGLVDAFAAVVSTYLDDGVRRGFVRDDLDTLALGRTLTALVIPTVLALARGPLSPAERAIHLDAIVGVGVAGMRSPDA